MGAVETEPGKFAQLNVPGVGLKSMWRSAPADREVLVPAKELVDGHHHRAPPPREGRVHGPVLGRAPVVLEGEPVAFLSHREHHPVGAAVAGAARFDVRPLLPLAVRQAGHLVEERLLGVVDDPLHHPLDRPRPVALDEGEDPRLRGGVARELGAEVEGDHLGLPRRPEVELLDVAPDDVLLDDLDRRNEDPLVVGALGGGAEAARGNPADVVLVQAVGDPAEELVLEEHRADEHHVLLVGGAHPGVVREKHVPVVDPRVVASMFEDPLHLGVRHPGHVLHVRAEIHELGVLGEDGGVEVERVHRDRRPGYLLDGGAVLLVHVPQVVADDLEGHRVHLRVPVAVEPQGLGDAEGFGGERRGSAFRRTGRRASR